MECSSYTLDPRGHNGAETQGSGWQEALRIHMDKWLRKAGETRACGIVSLRGLS